MRTCTVTNKDLYSDREATDGLQRHHAARPAQFTTLIINMVNNLLNICHRPNILGGFPWGSAGKESACNAGGLGLILGFGISPGEGKGYHSSILAWRIPWTLQSMGSQRVGHDWETFTRIYIHTLGAVTFSNHHKPVKYTQETEIQRGWVTHPKSHSKRTGCKPGSDVKPLTWLAGVLRNTGPNRCDNRR